MTADSSILDTSTPVLIVDDNESYAALLRRILQGALGYTDVQVFHSLEEAYEALCQPKSAYRLLFIDQHFPGSQVGTDLMLRLKQEGRLEGRAALLITSEPTVENLKIALANGASGVVAKPFDREEIHKKIEVADRALRLSSADSF